MKIKRLPTVMPEETRDAILREVRLYRKYNTNNCDVRIYWNTKRSRPAYIVIKPVDAELARRIQTIINRWWVEAQERDDERWKDVADSYQFYMTESYLKPHFRYPGVIEAFRMRASI